MFKTAGDFYEALTGRIPSLVLLDVMLTDEEGLHIVEKLRNDPLTQNVPVIMVTAKSTEMDKVRGLTHKEYELLKMLMFRAGIVTGRGEILDQVWGTDFQGESRTLDMHIKTLRQKLGEAGQ